MSDKKHRSRKNKRGSHIHLWQYKKNVQSINPIKRSKNDSDVFPPIKEERPARLSSNGHGDHNGHHDVASSATTGALPLADLSRQRTATLRALRTQRMLHRKRRQGRGVRTKARWFFTTLTVLLCICAIIATGVIGTAFAYYKTRQPLLEGIAEHELFQTTRLYDRTGKLMYELYDREMGKGRRVYVDYQDISPLLIEATVAAEDHSFWSNTGVDYTGIARAALSNIQHQSIVEGGSTVTQQLIKNQFFQGKGRTVQVKLEEAILATGLTRQFPKWKIMEMYLNTVFYGDINYGIEAAAEGLFGLKPECSDRGCKPAVSRLTLGQASLLAGLPQSPSVYNPISYKERALVRQGQVLQSMVELGMITSQQKQEAQEEMKRFRFRSYSETHKTLAPHFVNYVIEQLEPVIGAQRLRSGGFNIYTTIDLELQKKVEQIAYKHLYTQHADPYLGTYGPLYHTHNVNNSAVVVMKPTTGEILAMNGSASTDPKLSTPQMQHDFNVAISPRQPGSSFKPFVYATAFEMGWYPAMIVPDIKMYYPNGNEKPYSPQNYDGRFHGRQGMTVRAALANSFNIPAITTLEYVGIPNMLNMAARLGLTEVARRPLNTLGPSMALGAVEVSPLQMTAAYATFANKGVRAPTSFVRKITDRQGNEIYSFDPAKQKKTRVMREDVAFLISSVLSDHAARYQEFPPGNPLELPWPAAAKTGTTDSFRDNWTLGYTPQITVGVWSGNSDNTIMNNIIGITGAAPIWRDVMLFAKEHYKLPSDEFKPPKNVKKQTVSAHSGLEPRPGEATVSDWFIEGTKPTILSPEPPPPPKQHKDDKKHSSHKKKHHHDDDDDDDDDDD